MCAGDLFDEGACASARRCLIESIDGICLDVKVQESESRGRVRLHVVALRDAAGGELKELEGLKDATLWWTREGWLNPGLPASCQARLPDGQVGTLRLPGVQRVAIA